MSELSCPSAFARHSCVRAVNRSALLAVPFALLLLTACGGGGGGGAAAPTTTPPPAAQSPSIADISASQSFQANQQITAIVFTNTGGDVRASNGCSATSLPSGLSVEATTVNSKRTCTISGTPNTPASAVTVTVTAVNGSGNDSATVSIEITVAAASAPPNLQDIPVPQIFREGRDVGSVAFSNTGVGVQDTGGCSASNLPAGLSAGVVDASGTKTCAITGSPTTITADGQPIVATVTATNGAGSDTADITLTVLADPTSDPSLSNIDMPAELLVGMATNDPSFENSGGGPLSCALGTGQTLPSGLYFAISQNGRTCRVFGTPDAVGDMRTYTVVATGISGATNEATVAIGVVSTPSLRIIDTTGVVAPNEVAALTASGMDFSSAKLTSVPGADAAARFTYAAGSPGIDISMKDAATLADAGVFSTRYAADSGSQKGMTAIGQVVIADLRRYVGGRIAFDIKADNGFGSYTMKLRVDHHLPAADSTPAKAGCDCEVDIDTSAITSGAWTTVQVDIDSLTGHATEALNLRYVSSPIVIYPDIAEQVASAAPALSFSLRNVRWEGAAAGVPPVIASDQGEYTFPLNQAVDINLLNNGGSRPTDCTVSPALPTGLGIAVSSDGATCTLSGTPTAVASATVYTFTATNAVGSTSTDISIAATDLLAPKLPDTVAGQNAIDGVAITTVSLANSGGTAASCVFVDAGNGDAEVATLGSLTVAATSAGDACEIGGSLALSGGVSQTFTVRAKNATGMDDATVSFAVVAATVPSLPAPQADYEVDHEVQITTPVVLANANADAAAALAAGACQLLDMAGDPLTAGADMSYVFQGLVLTTNVTDNRCEVSGTPDTRGRNLLRVRATAAQGAGNTVELTFIVRDEDALSFDSATVTKVIGEASFTNALTAASGETAFAWVSSTPTVATVGAATGEVSIVAVGTTTITATRAESDEYKEALASYDLLVNPMAPDLDDSVAGQAAVDGVAITTLAIGNTGGPAASCVFVDADNGNAEVAVLDGLMVAANGAGDACEIDGALALANDASQTFTVRAKNATDDDDVTVTFTVTAASVPVLSAPQTVYEVDHGVQITTPVVLANANTEGVAALAAGGCQLLDMAGDPLTAGADMSYVSQGLVLTTNVTDNRCEVSGTPDTRGRNLLRVRATAAQGAGNTVELTFIVRDEDALSFDSATVTKVIGEANFTNAPTAASGETAFTWVSSTPTVATVGAATGEVSLVAVGMTTITATRAESDEYKEALASYDLLVNPMAPDLDDSVADQDAIDGNTVALSIANNGGPAASCVFVDADNGNAEVALLDGLTVAATSAGDACDIGGAIALANGSSQTFTVRAKNATDDDDVTVTFNIAVAAPSLDDSVPAQDAIDGNTVALSIANNGGPAASCVFVDADNGNAEVALLDGLTVAATSAGDACDIGGAIALANGSSQTFTVRAKNATDDDDVTVTFNIAVAAPSLDDSVPAQAAVDGVAITTPLAIGNTGGPAASCVFVDADNAEFVALDGLTVAATSAGDACEIGGALALSNGASQIFTVRARNVTASDDVTVTFNVAVARPALEAPAAQILPTGSMARITLTNSGGGELLAIDAMPDPGCQVDPSLPNGLSLALDAEGDTCVISGTPSTAQTATDYMVTATNVTGDSTATVSIAIVAGVAAFASVDPLVYTVGDDIDESFLNTNTSGGPVTACAPASALPSGITVSHIVAGNGCALSGTANAMAAEATYTITATNGNGDSTLVITITVNAVAPEFAADIANPDAITRGGELDHSLALTMGGFIPDDDSTSGVGCSFVASDADGADAIADGHSDAYGLSVDSADDLGADSMGHGCSITGTPTLADSEIDGTSKTLNLFVRAANASGSDVASITLIVNPKAPALATPDPAAYTFDVGDADIEISLSLADDADPATACSSAQLSMAGDALYDAGLRLALAAQGQGCSITNNGALSQAAAETMVTVVASSDADADGMASLSITINGGPTADAGDDITVNAGETATLDGSGSADAEDGAAGLIYMWEYIGTGTDPTLTGANTDTASFTATVAQEGMDFEFRLTVTDSGELSDSDDLSVHVNAPPTVTATATPELANPGEAVMLVATGADSDALASELSYAWTHSAGMTAGISDANMASAVFTPTMAQAGGTIVFTVTVTDADRGSGTETVSVQVNSAPTITTQPAASSTIRIDGAVTLTCAASDVEDDAGELVYSWEQQDNGAPTYAVPDLASLVFNAQTSFGGESFEFVCTVTDSKGLTATSDTATVTVDGPPEADAGDDQMVSAGDSVTLDGSDSTDPESEPLNYMWTQDTGPSVDLMGATTASPTFSVTAAHTGTLVFMLTVTDAQGQTDRDSVEITVSNVAPEFATNSTNVTRDVERTTAVEIDLALLHSYQGVDGANGCQFVNAMAGDDNDSANDTVSAMVAGLSVAPVDLGTGSDNACRISGTPEVTVDGTEQELVLYVRASNEVGQDYAIVTITVTPVPPMLENIGLEHHDWQTQVEIKFTNMGDPVTGCMHGGNLPDDFTLAMGDGDAEDEVTCVISGSADTIIDPAVEVTVTASNGSGTDSAATVSIRVTDLSPFTAPTPEGGGAHFVLSTGTEYTGDTAPRFINSSRAQDYPATSGGCAVEPALSDGLTLGITDDGSTCEITGTPTRAGGLASYTVTRTTSDSREREASISILVVAGNGNPAVHLLELPGSMDNPIQLYYGQATGLPIVFLNNVPSITSCDTQTTAQSSALALLNLEVAPNSAFTTCVIQLIEGKTALPGSPPAGFMDGVTREFEVYASIIDRRRQAPASVFIRVNIADETMAPALVAPPSPLVIDTGVAVNYFIANGGSGSDDDILGCSLTGESTELPVGLRLGVDANRDGCRITGRARVPQDATTYTVRAINNIGMSDQEISITVNLSRPSIGRITSTLGASYDRMAAIGSIQLQVGSLSNLPRSFPNRGGAPDTCTVAAAFHQGASAMLAEFGLGLFAENFTCVIRPLDGKGPTAPTNDLAITISARNAEGPTNPDFDSGARVSMLNLTINPSRGMSP